MQARISVAPHHGASGLEQRMEVGMNASIVRQAVSREPALQSSMIRAGDTHHAAP